MPSYGPPLQDPGLSVCQQGSCAYTAGPVHVQNQPRISLVCNRIFWNSPASGSIAVFNDDQRVRSVFINNKTLRWTTRASGDVTSLAMTPSGSAILVGTDNGNADLFDEYGNITWSYASITREISLLQELSVLLFQKRERLLPQGQRIVRIIALNSTRQHNLVKPDKRFYP